MTQPTIYDQPVTDVPSAKPSRTSFTQHVLRFFRARPGVWIAAVQLESVAGRQAWRTRVSEARQLLEAQNEGTIQNRQRRMKDASGRPWTLSEYAFVPTREAAK